MPVTVKRNPAVPMIYDVALGDVVIGHTGRSVNVRRWRISQGDGIWQTLRVTTRHAAVAELVRLHNNKGGE